MRTLTWLDALTMDRDPNEDDSDYFHELACEGPSMVARYSLAVNPDAHFTPYRTLESGKTTLTRQGVADLSFEAESPVAPPDELLEGLPSYDWLLQGRGGQVFFPSLESLGRSQDPASWSSVLEHSRVPVVTEEVAREALVSFVNSQCCYSSAAAGNIIIQELRQQTLCRYRLETFSESRVSEWTFQPVTNHSVDGPQRGASPRLWDMKVQVPPMFQEDTRKFQVPHSSLVKGELFPFRNVTNATGVAAISAAAATGPAWCSTCSGRGNKTCATCKGERKLEHFVQLVIMWKNSLFEFVSPHHLHCPGELLAKARGENLFRDENAVVYPIVDFPLRDISLASQRGIEEHNTALASRSARILQQRQTIELVPITEVHYWYQGKTSVYYIYGTDHQVYVADYPKRYCCGCTIL
ncbi:hypothetical protein U0070_002871 [Myodes glareolus]|uniref:Protein SSUH2 homolog n=1 Tax=Myodes glareolus TaxID=447135 RepID=A0AAW0II87_MYOGA